MKSVHGAVGGGGGGGGGGRGGWGGCHIARGWPEDGECVSVCVGGGGGEHMSFRLGTSRKPLTK